MILILILIADKVAPRSGGDALIQVLLRFFRRLVDPSAATARRLVVVIGLLVVVSSSGFYLCERAAQPDLTVQDALWWSIVTMTTVGYGDLFPLTWQGRWLVAAPTMLVGIGVLGYAIGVLTTAVIEHHDRELHGMNAYQGKGHVLLCNCPTPEVILEVLHELRADPTWSDRGVVLVTDAFEQLPDAFQRARVHFVHGNPSREAALKQAGVKRAHRALVFAQHPRDPNCDNQTLGVLVTIRALAPSLYTVVECVAREDMKLLRNAGADEIVETGSLSAGLMVQGAQDPGINGVLAELLTNQSGYQFYIEPVQQFRGSFATLRKRLSQSGEALLLGLVDEGQHRFLPKDNFEVAPGHRAIVLGRSRPPSL